MLPDIIFILPILELISAAQDLLNSDDSNNADDDINVILSFMKVLPFLLQIFVEGYELTKDVSREDDAYKLIRYLAEYR